MENYKPNSNKYKEAQREAARDAQRASNEEPRVVPQKIISGTATVKQKSAGKKFLDAFVAGDAKKAKDYVVEDILIPSAKKAVSEVFKSFIDIFLYGEAGRSKSSSLPGSKVSYTKYYSDRNYDRERERPAPAVRSIFDYDNYEFTSMGDAETVLTAMNDLIRQYGMVRVADFYDMIGETNNNHCANNYGWTDLRSAKIVRTRDGYVIDFPKAMVID